MLCVVHVSMGLILIRTEIHAQCSSYIWLGGGDYCSIKIYKSKKELF